MTDILIDHSTRLGLSSRSLYCRYTDRQEEFVRVHCNCMVNKMTEDFPSVGQSSRSLLWQKP